MLWLLSAVPVSAGAVQPQGRAALLLDASSGQILYQQNAHVRNFPASTTKLLTALVAVEHGKLDQKITISEQAVDKAPDSSSCYLNKGEEQPLEYLLYGLLLASGNDCADAIAEGISGGKPEQFVTWMNETARRAGATGSHFTNPSGLHDDNHYTTALDLALISRAAIANPIVRKISGTKEFNWPGKSEDTPERKGNGPYYNHNQMVFTYDGTVAGKTGYTEEAGLTLVNAAERNGMVLIGVVMGEQLKEIQYQDMTDLLDMGFADFERKPIVMAGAQVASLAVTGGMATTVSAVTGKDFWVAAPKGGKPQVTTQPLLEASVAAPVEAGKKLGELEVREGDRLLGTVPLVAGQHVAAKPATGAKLLSGALTALKWGLGGVLGLFVFRTVVKLTRRIIRRLRKRPGVYQGTGSKARSRTSTITMYRTRD
ncbi:MAG TPA: D-alanyl-D-alanine carboxypeptidase family protein [Symbiobacteriaceae bacterium]|nr:D-alanyl-D-alanine carboxypeptidase family protein [Symbiobacteriaceae bacterium]